MWNELRAMRWVLWLHSEWEEEQNPMSRLQAEEQELCLSEEGLLAPDEE